MSSAAPEHSLVLICIAGPDNGKRVAVTGKTIALGRSSGCELASDDPEVAERHLNLELRNGKIAFASIDGGAVFVDGQRLTQGTVEPPQQLRAGRSIWRQENASGTDLSSFIGNLGQRISDAAGLEKIEGFNAATMFSEVWRKRPDEEMEDYFAVGTATTTPNWVDVDTNWPKPWLFVKIFILAALVYFGLVFVWQNFHNEKILPGLMTVGALVMPFSMLIFFFEVNVARNVSLYQILKMLFLGGIVSLILTLSLYQLTNWGTTETWMGAVGIGLIEEAGKVGALLLIINKLKYRWLLNGMLFGAAVGAGFAAFESAGYAFDIGTDYGSAAMLHSITERGLLCICGGHVLWCALTGAALWRVRADGKFEWSMLQDRRFLRAYALAVGMHAIWDAPFELPIYLKYVALGFVAWVAILSYVQVGLRQIRGAQTVKVVSTT